MNGQVPSFVVDVTRAANAASRLYFASSFFKYMASFPIAIFLELAAEGDSQPPAYMYGLVLLTVAATIVAGALRWRLDAAAYRAGAGAIAFGLVALAFVCLALFINAGSDDPHAAAVTGMLATCLVAIASGFAWNMLSALRMLGLHDRQGRIATIDAANAVSQLYRSKRRAMPLLHWPTRPLATLLYAVPFILLLVFVGLLLHEPNRNGSNPATSFMLPGGALGTFLVYMIRRNYAFTAEKLLLHDHRAPLLFLRSFSDDRSRVRAKGGWFAKMRSRTVEESIAHVADCLGPFVAIANPGQALPALGAAKSFYANDTWQQKIQDWVQLSQMIVMAAGRTHWVRWELDEIARAGALGKLIVLVPPDPPEDPFRRKLWLNEYFNGTRYAQAVAEIAIAQTLALVFRNDRLIVIRRDGARKKEVDFVVAFNMAVWMTRLEPAAG